MSLATTDSRFVYDGDASTTEFSFPRKVIEAAHLKVYLYDEDDDSMTLQVLNTDYTFSGTGLSNGIYASATITFTTAPGSDKKVVIYRDPTLTQEVDFTGDSNVLTTLNRFADRVEMKLQRLDDRLDRAFVLPDGDYQTALTNSYAKADWANKVLGFDASGNPEPLTNNGSSTSVTNLARDTYAVTQTLANWMDFDDTSTVLGSKTKFFYPDIFGVASTGRVYRFNRVFIGGAALSSADRQAGPPDGPTTKDYLQTASGAGTKSAQLSALAAIGTLGIVGASRTSDYRSWVASPSAGSQGVTGFAINDDTGSGSPIAAAVVGIALHESGITGITENEFAVANAGTVADVRSHGGVVANATIAANITVGWTNANGAHTYTNNASCAINIGTISASTNFRRGIVVSYRSLDTSLGSGGNGIAMELYTGQSLQWVDSADATLVEAWGDSNGFTVQGAQNPARFINTTDAAANRALRIESDRATPTNGDSVVAGFYLSDSAGNQDEFARLSAVAIDVTSTSEEGRLDFYVMDTGTLTAHVTLSASYFRPLADGGHGLGSPSVAWNALNLSSGAIIGWNNSDVTITHSANALAFAGGSSGYSFDSLVQVSRGSAAADAPARLTNTTDAVSNYGLIVESDRATPAANDNVRIAFFLSNGSGTQTEFGHIRCTAATVTAGAEDGGLDFYTRVSGTLTAKVRISGSAILPLANDGLALGAATTAYSDLFLASGGVINLNNGDWTLTHSSNLATVAGGDLRVATGCRFDTVDTQSTVGAAGGASALPATPTGYIPIKVNGTEYVVPYYAAS